MHRAVVHAKLVIERHYLRSIEKSFFSRLFQRAADRRSWRPSATRSGLSTGHFVLSAGLRRSFAQTLDRSPGPRPFKSKAIAQSDVPGLPRT